jgi:hypothetical protein
MKCASLRCACALVRCCCVAACAVAGSWRVGWAAVLGRARPEQRQRRAREARESERSSRRGRTEGQSALPDTLAAPPSRHRRTGAASLLALPWPRTRAARDPPTQPKQKRNAMLWKYRHLFPVRCVDRSLKRSSVRFAPPRPLFQLFALRPCGQSRQHRDGRSWT